MGKDRKMKKGSNIPKLIIYENENGETVRLSTFDD
jgi:hypothetical protein